MALRPCADATQRAGRHRRRGRTRPATEAARPARRAASTQTVTWRQLDDALAELARSLQRAAQPHATISPRGCGTSRGRPRPWPTWPRRWPASAATRSARTCCSGRRPASNAIAAHRADLVRGADDAAALRLRLEELEEAARSMALEMEFDFLLDPERMLLSIGYLVARRHARRQLLRPAGLGGAARKLLRHRQGRRSGAPLVPPGPRGDAGRPWRGADLVVGIDVRISDAVAGHAGAGRKPARADQSADRAPADRLRRQTLGVPWGVSESAYNARDLEFTYQYSNFGVPGLGLKRGLADNVVVAPYATALATMVDPQAAVRQFGAARRSRRARPLRLLRGAGLHAGPGARRAASVAIVRAFMAHHQGMTIVAIADALLDGVMRARFHAEPIVQATELLLQERMPRDVAVAQPWASEVKSPAQGARRRTLPAVGGFSSAHQATPADASAVERPLHRHADGRRLRLQPLARLGRDPLARRRDLRRLGLLCLPAGRAQRQRLVGRLSAERRRAR